MFCQNFKVVHSCHGIGEIVAVDTRKTQAGEDRIWTCRFPQDEGVLTLQVSEDRGLQRIRGLIDPAEVPRVLQHLTECVLPPTPPSTQGRKRHFREKVKERDIYRRCELLRELSRLKWRMPGEQTMLVFVRQQLVAELALVSGLPDEEIGAQIDQICQLEPPARPGARPRASDPDHSKATG